MNTDRMTPEEFAREVAESAIRHAAEMGTFAELSDPNSIRCIMGQPYCPSGVEYQAAVIAHLQRSLELAQRK